MAPGSAAYGLTAADMQVVLLSLNGMNRNQPLINWANANADK